MALEWYTVLEPVILARKKPLSRNYKPPCHLAVPVFELKEIRDDINMILNGSSVLFSHPITKLIVRNEYHMKLYTIKFVSKSIGIL